MIFYKGILYKTQVSNKSFVYEFNDSNVISIHPSKILLKIIIDFDEYSKNVVRINLYSFAGLLAYLGGLFKGVSIFFMILVWPVREI